jgi:hypothetical protein
MDGHTGRANNILPHAPAALAAATALPEPGRRSHWLGALMRQSSIGGTAEAAPFFASVRCRLARVRHSSRWSVADIPHVALARYAAADLAHNASNGLRHAVIDRDA